MARRIGYSEVELLRDLRKWWEEEVGAKDPFAQPKRADTIYDLQPEIDSLAVVACLVIIEKHVGFEVSPTLIRRGGYRSFEDMVADLFPKIRALAKKQLRAKTVA